MGPILSSHAYVFATSLMHTFSYFWNKKISVFLFKQENTEHSNLDVHALHELRLLEHVSETPTLRNREATRILGVSVKLSHQILTSMGKKGWFHVTKHHARR